MRATMIGKDGAYYNNSMEDLHIMLETNCEVCGKLSYNSCFRPGKGVSSVCCLEHAKELLLTQIELLMEDIKC